MTPSIMFCGMCERDKDFTHHVEHFQNYLKNYVMLEVEYNDKRDELSNETLIQSMEANTKNPTLNPRTEIDFEKYKFNHIIRYKK